MQGPRQYIGTHDRIVDVDRDLLKELNAHGSVRNMRDRRTDLYEVKLLKGNTVNDKTGPGARKRSKTQ